MSAWILYRICICKELTVVGGVDAQVDVVHVQLECTRNGGDGGGANGGELHKVDG